MTAAARPLVIVLARGGSKGLPGKNVAPVAGKPCVQWTIEHAMEARCRPLVAVSSDDARVRAIAASLGAIALDRPTELASDAARVDDAARHAAERVLQDRTDVSAASPIAILYGNVPVRPEGLLDRAIERLVATGCDSVQSYAGVGKHHPWWIARVDPSDGRVTPWEGDVLNHGIFRRQDLPPAFVPDGGVIALTHAALFGKVQGVQPGPHAFFGRDRRGVINQPGEVVDIDDRIDLLVADATLRERISPNAVRRA